MEDSTRAQREVNYQETLKVLPLKTLRKVFDMVVLELQHRGEPITLLELED